LQKIDAHKNVLQKIGSPWCTTLFTTYKNTNKYININMSKHANVNDNITNRNNKT